MTFNTIEKTLNLYLQQGIDDFLEKCRGNGSLISSSSISQVWKIGVGADNYYCKFYFRARKSIMAPFLKSRREWENLQLFKTLEIPVPPTIAFIEERSLFGYHCGCLITREIKNCTDLSTLFKKGYPLLKDRHWLSQVINKIATYLKRVHGINFYHGDLKCRNILVSLEAQPEVYFIDSPQGKIKKGRQVDDLLTLDKRAMRELSRTQRLRFYLSYLNKKMLSTRDKKDIRRLLRRQAAVVNGVYS